MKKETNPVRLLIIFIAAVLLLALTSIAYKIIVQITESTFSYPTQNVLAIDRDVYILHLNNEDKKMVKIKFPFKRDEFINRSKLSSSILLGIPIDAILVSNDQLSFQEKEIGVPTVIDTIFSAKKYRLIDLNNYDLLKVALIIASVREEDKKNVELEIPNAAESVLRQVDNSEFDLIEFRDRDIFNEKISIEIVNSTGIDGLGGLVTTMLKRVGFNVVSTESGTDEITYIQIRNEDFMASKTLSRIKSIFQIEKIEQNNDLITDISIVIGRDLEESFSAQ